MAIIWPGKTDVFNCSLPAPLMLFCSSHYVLHTSMLVQWSKKNMHFSSCMLQVFLFFSCGGQKTFLPFFYGNLTSDLIIAMSHSRVVVIHLDFTCRFSGSELCIWFSVIWHQSMATVCMVQCFQGGPEEPFGGAMMTVGRLVSCRRVGERIQEMSLWLSGQNKYHTVGTPEKRLALYVLISCLGFLYCLCSCKTTSLLWCPHPSDGVRR